MVCASFNLFPPWHKDTVSDTERAGLACSQIIGPSLGVGGSSVIPHKCRDTITCVHGSALLVHQGKDAVSQVRTHISGIVTRRRLVSSCGILSGGNGTQQLDVDYWQSRNQPLSILGRPCSSNDRILARRHTCRRDNHSFR